MKAGEVFDERRDIEKHVFGVALLSDNSVDSGGETEVHGVGYIGGVDEPGTERSGFVAAFGAEIGAVVVFEIIADGVIVGDGVAGDVFVGALAGDGAGGFADDDSEFTFVVHEGDSCRTASLSVVTDKGCAGFGERERLFGRIKLEFLGVVDIVETEGKNGAGDDGRKPSH